MEWAQVLTIVGVNLALIGAMATLVIWAVNKLDDDIKTIGIRMDAHATRMDGHATRIDQLYQVILGMLKERK